MKAERETFLDMIRLLKSGENYRIPKLMDLFIDLPGSHQKNLLKFICTENPQPGWEELLGDNTLYLELIRSILFYYTGREEARQPTRQQLIELIGKYTRDSTYKSADAAPEESFMDLFEDEVKP